MQHYLTAYVFSTENWKRSEEEVSGLMNFALHVARNEIDEMHKKGIRVLFLGSREKLSEELLQAIMDAEQKTKDNSRGTVGLCFNYGGHLEIVDAVKQIVSDGLSEDEVTEEELQKRLYHPELPQIDLVIRTSGESRLSNFMLWRVAYSELLFVDKHWPAFKVADLEAALAEFASRQRRFGT